MAESASSTTEQPAPPPSSWTQRIFAVSWLSYFSYYFTRKNFSVAKASFGKELGFDKGDLKVIDQGYLIAYAVGQVGNGFLADVVGPRRMVALGMLMTAALNLAFGLGDTLIGSVLGVYTLCWTLNGLAQSTGWPGNGKLMASWFSTGRRGQVMGVWSTCYQAGGLAAGFFAAWLIGYGWRVSMIGPAAWVAVVGLAFWMLIHDRPSDLGYANPDVPAGLSREELRALRRKAWPLVLKNPMTWCLGLSYFCLKLMRYAFLFWLPYYLNTALGYGDRTAGYMAQAFDGGGIPFVILAGWLADRHFGRRRIAVAAGCLVLLAGALYLYQRVGDESAVANVLALALVGAFLFGADSLVSGAAAQDLGGPHAAALACGLINGIGSIGGVVQGDLVKAMEWHDLFRLFIGLSIFGALVLVPFLRVRPTSHPTAA